MPEPQTKPFHAKVLGIRKIDGTNFVAFDGMNGLYPIPHDFEEVIRTAAKQDRNLILVFGRDGIKNAELAPTSANASRSGFARLWRVFLSRCGQVTH